jgi:hypothetical protein
LDVDRRFRGAASIIALKIEAARTSETSVDMQLRTRQYIQEDSELQEEKWTLVELMVSRIAHSIVSGYGLDDLVIEVRSPAEPKGFVL